MKNKEKIIALVSILLWASCLQASYGRTWMTMPVGKGSVAEQVRLENLGLGKSVQKALALPEINVEVQTSQADQPKSRATSKKSKQSKTQNQASEPQSVAQLIFKEPVIRVQPALPELKSVEISYNQGPVNSLQDFLVPKVTIKKPEDQESLDLAGDKKDANSIVVSPEQLRRYLQSMPRLDRGPFVDMLLQQPEGKGPIIIWNADMSKSLQISRDVAAEALQLVENAPVKQQAESMEFVPVVQQKAVDPIDRDIQEISVESTPVQKSASLSAAAQQIEQATTPVAKIGILTAIKKSFLRMLGFKLQDLSVEQSKTVDARVMESENQIELVDASELSPQDKQKSYMDIMTSMLQSIKDLFVAKPVNLSAE